jgi:pimeloyl-ACP methyl ester carboxylesterase
MRERISSAQKVVIEDAAHLPNMDQPEEFQAYVTRFLSGLSN